jgi:hypothetical protein
MKATGRQQQKGEGMSTASVGAKAPQGKHVTGGSAIAVPFQPARPIATHTRPPVAPSRVITRAGENYTVISVATNAMNPNRATVLLEHENGELYYAFTRPDFQRITTRTPVFHITTLDGWHR